MSCISSGYRQTLNEMSLRIECKQGEESACGISTEPNAIAQITGHTHVRTTDYETKTVRLHSKLAER